MVTGYQKLARGRTVLRGRSRNLFARVVWLMVLVGALVLGWSPGASAEQEDSRPLAAPSGKVLLAISGAIKRFNRGNEAHFDRAMIEQLPSHTVSTSTSVSDGVSRFDGPLMRDLLHYVGAHGSLVQAQALNNYSVEIPASDFLDYDVLLALSMDGKQLEPTDKGPLWIVYPRDQQRRLQDIRYDYRWVWQLNRLIVQ